MVELILPYINIYLPQVYTGSLSWTPSLLLTHTIPLGRPSAPAPSIQYHALNLGWRLISYMILYMFQCHSLKSSHPLTLPQSPKDCSAHLCLFCCLGYRVIENSRQLIYFISEIKVSYHPIHTLLIFSTVTLADLVYFLLCKKKLWIDCGFQWGKKKKMCLL